MEVGLKVYAFDLSGTRRLINKAFWDLIAIAPSSSTIVSLSSSVELKPEQGQGCEAQGFQIPQVDYSHSAEAEEEYELAAGRRALRLERSVFSHSYVYIYIYIYYISHLSSLISHLSSLIDISINICALSGQGTYVYIYNPNICIDMRCTMTRGCHGSGLLLSKKIYALGMYVIPPPTPHRSNLYA